MRTGRPRKFKLPNCLQCNAIVKRNTSKFCSTKCRGEYNHEHKLKFGGFPKKARPLCLQCDKPVSRPNSTYCSKSCLAKFNNPKRKRRSLKNCKECNKRYEAKEKRDHIRSKFCSLRCLWDSFKHRVSSEETRIKLSKAASLRNLGRTYSRGASRYRKDIGHYVRSSWEANVCRLLNHLNIDYEYEKHRFKLIDDNGKETRYTPDMKIHNRFIEVKGWWNERSLLVRKLMKEQYPNIRITYIDEKVYNRLLKKFSKQISNWEFKARRQKKGVISTCQD